MSISEIGRNYVPQNSDVTFRFTVTQDSGSVDFSKTTAWIFTVSTGNFTTPILSKSSTGTLSSGDFTVSSGSSLVSVFLRASEIGNAYGQFLYALHRQNTSGSRITHLQKYFTVQQQLAPSGV